MSVKLSLSRAGMASAIYYIGLGLVLKGEPFEVLEIVAM